MKITIVPKQKSNWSLEIDTEATRQKYLLVNHKTFFCDMPIVYDDKTIAYDNPYRIPKYVKNFVRKALI